MMMVCRPEFKGNAADFAIIYPTPDRPEVTEAPIKLFTELNNATNPPRQWTRTLEVVPMAAEALTFAESVTVIEQKDVGDYTATVLTATNSDDLVTWLIDNGYEFDKPDRKS